MPFASLCFFTYAYPVSILLKNSKEVLAVRTSHRKEVLALLSCSQFLRLQRPPLQPRLSPFRHPFLKVFPPLPPKVLLLQLVWLTWMHVAFINLGLHRVLLGFCRQLLHPGTPPVPVATPTNVLTGISSSLILQSFVPVFFLGFLVFYSTLSFGGLQPSNYN